MSQKHLSALSNMFFKLSIIGMYQVSSIYWKKRIQAFKSGDVLMKTQSLKRLKKIFKKMLMQHCGTGGVISEGIFNLVLSSIKKMCEITVPELCNLK